MPKVSGLKWSAKRSAILAVVIVTTALVWFSFPAGLFDAPYSTVVYDRHGKLLGARIAGDGQWRFPEIDSVPEKFRVCLLEFEDRNFYYHPGINPLSLFRALQRNIAAGRVISGGSTLTMQVARLARPGKPRTPVRKVIEMWKALRLEARFSKSGILCLYASHAPFGGNVVGLPAASWRYFGRPPEDLSWAEAALLAVLPNAPSALHPGKNRERLKAKRDRLLERLMDRGVIDALTFELACGEPLPQAPLPLPSLARHLVDRLHRESPGKNHFTGIDANLQEKAELTAGRHREVLDGNEVYNSAVIVIDMATGQVLAYVGNTARSGDEEHSPDVDLVTAPRSTGSILKPFLFAAMLDAGEMLPGTLLPDIPSYFSGFSPKNFSLTYDGAVPAGRALSRSLNIPAVHMLRSYGVAPFYDLLKGLGMTTLARPAGHYGLSLILGGAEGTLWDISYMYLNLGRSLLDEKGTESLVAGTESLNLKPSLSPEIAGDLVQGTESLVAGTESPGEFRPPPLQKFPFSAAAAWLTLKALADVNRPEEEEGWRSFASSRQIAWKTGTSFGFRDAWAIGLTPDYVVGVWAGNADGEGRPGLTGVSAASPLLFSVFRLLPAADSWFPQPYDDMETVEVCRQSGHRASPACPQRDSVFICRAGLRSDPCPYHRIVHLDESGRYRVNASCCDPAKMQTAAWFVLPPAWAWYYRSHEPAYRDLPPWLPGCTGDDGLPMQFIYPAGDRKVVIPTGLDGKPGEIVFEAAHQSPSTIIYWHLDGEYAGFTRDLHKMSLAPAPGKHTLTLIDEYGNRIESGIEVK
jgi:penicillin-binding protein 1C